jgi:hypothetical protein
MKTIKIIKSLCLILTLICFSQVVNSQNATLPSEVTSIVNLNLEDAQGKLKNIGYEICHSSLFAKSQDWFNENSKNCVTVKFDKKTKKVTEVKSNPNISDCQKGLEASRKVWDKYHDGQAPVSDTKLDQERQKLTDQGFKAAYWVDEISPGRCIEYWVNDNIKKTMYIVWEKQSNKWVTTDKSEYSMGKNPAHK